MESAAGRYTFVWKKAVTKFQNRLAEQYYYTNYVYTTKAKFLYLSYHSAAFCLIIFYFYFHFITRLTQLLTIVKVLEFKATKLYY